MLITTGKNIRFCCGLRVIPLVIIFFKMTYMLGVLIFFYTGRFIRFSEISNDITPGCFTSRPTYFQEVVTYKKMKGRKIDIVRNINWSKIRITKIVHYVWKFYNRCSKLPLLQAMCALHRRTMNLWICKLFQRYLHFAEYPQQYRQFLQQYRRDAVALQK